MTRRLIALAAAGIACSLTGCFMFRPNPAHPHVDGKVVETPPISQASGETAERVDHVGTDLVAATALGIPDVDFYTVGSAEPELFHRDTKLLYISEGLANRCKTDDELAAVLAIEVGRMTAEFRRGLRKQVKEPIPAVASAPKFDGSTDLDPARDVYLAQYDQARQAPAAKKDWATTDPHEIAVELLRNAGREPKLLDQVAPLVKAAGNNSARRPGVAGPAPTWSR
jgi:predicted Zn-dependent protease